jgi:A/G-specific adenine glycosylase
MNRPAEFRRLILAWYRKHQRRLPWRENPSLYQTVVSEFMLQQTQVKTALGHFERWLERFPDFDALAEAPEAEVLKHWEGLGYYNRARNLHRLAKAVALMDPIPHTPETWQTLPGVGPYTAAAITSIAFGARAACVDGNVVRILSRIQADDTQYRNSTAAAAACASLAEELLDPDNPGDHNQAMMELGATVCSRRRPLCAACPVATFCRAAETGNPEAFPRFVSKKIEKQEVTRLWCRRGDSLLLYKSAAGSRRLAELYELPQPAHLGLPNAISEGLGPPLARKVRHITRFRISETIYAYPAKHLKLPANKNGLEWVSGERLDRITLSGPHRRWVRELLAEEGSAAR